VPRLFDIYFMGRTHDITISGFDLNRIEAELKVAKETIKTLEIRHAAVMLHTQSVVNENTKLRELVKEVTQWHSIPDSGDYN
jgi:vacuolar-type H+-ATPase subunit D/Vma8